MAANIPVGVVNFTNKDVLFLTCAGCAGRSAVQSSHPGRSM